MEEHGGSFADQLLKVHKKCSKMLIENQLTISEI